MGKEGWQGRKNPEFCYCVQFIFFWGKKRNFKVYLVSKTRWEVSRTNLEEFTGRSRGGNKQNS